MTRPASGHASGLFGGVPGMARSAVMGWGTTDVRLVTGVVNRESLDGLARLLESRDVRVVIGAIDPLGEAANAVAHMAARRATGKVVIAV